MATFWSALVQIITCCLLGAKPSPEPMLTYSQINLTQHFSERLLEIIVFIQENAFENVIWQMLFVLSGPQWVNLPRLQLQVKLSCIYVLYILSPVFNVLTRSVWKSMKCLTAQLLNERIHSKTKTAVIKIRLYQAGDVQHSNIWVYVMACYLAAPSHYLIQCYCVISVVLWHSSQAHYSWYTQGITPSNMLQISP